MELTDAKLCSDCNRVFDEFRHDGVCPWCTCPHGIRVADFLPPMWGARPFGHNEARFKVAEAVGLNLG